MTAPNVRLCALDDIPDQGSAGFVIEAPKDSTPDHAGRTLAIMAIRRGQTVYSYLNRCPHVGAPLDFTPGRFLDRAGEHILCSTHGALFRIEDGACLSGPCAGRGLSPLANTVRAGDVWLTV